MKPWLDSVRISILKSAKTVLWKLLMNEDEFQLMSILKQVNQLLKLFLQFYMLDENSDEKKADIKFRADFTEFELR
jgi:hypothetical protein